METKFSLLQLQDAGTAEAEKILRTCVHCGFCTATCPTYLVLGDELDSPRGRIYQIKHMLESQEPATSALVTHIDRCLSCLSCMTTCPSGVDYGHLLDYTRTHIAKTHQRGKADQMMRFFLQTILPYPDRFRLALLLAKIVRPFAPIIQMMAGKSQMGQRLMAMMRLIPRHIEAPTRHTLPGVFEASKGADQSPKTTKTKRVALLTGCAQPVLDSDINAAAIRLLTRMGYDVVLPEGEGCCGALVHHMGEEDKAKVHAKRNIEVWCREMDTNGLDAIVITTSGCGTSIKDYGHMFRNDPLWREKAQKVSTLARDICEFINEIKQPLTPIKLPDISVAYHAACSLQHGQHIKTAPKSLLKKAGLTVRDITESHICCGSAGVYNIMQPQLAQTLQQRKCANIETIQPDVIAAGNIGCITQIGTGTKRPVLHVIQLLDWAYGGPKPAKLSKGSNKA
ncbi:MAG: glycolate oxidase subunit GlcF [Cohaesibacter sp.]|nr:glycolate oxidase subunit GlcF [Cohaesibacter sp.]